jgi:hypothetical protein
MWVVNSGMQVGNKQQCRRLNKTFNEALYLLVASGRQETLRSVALQFFHIYYSTVSEVSSTFSTKPSHVNVLSFNGTDVAGDTKAA